MELACVPLEPRSILGSCGVVVFDMIGCGNGFFQSVAWRGVAWRGAARRAWQLTRQGRIKARSTLVMMAARFTVPGVCCLNTAGT